MDRTIKLVVKSPCSYSEAGRVLDEIIDYLDNPETLPDDTFTIPVEIRADRFVVTIKRLSGDKLKVIVSRIKTFEETMKEVEKLLKG